MFLFLLLFLRVCGFISLGFPALPLHPIPPNKYGRNRDVFNRIVATLTEAFLFALLFPFFSIRECSLSAYLKAKRKKKQQNKRENPFNVARIFRTRADTFVASFSVCLCWSKRCSRKRIAETSFDEENRDCFWTLIDAIFEESLKLICDLQK